MNGLVDATSRSAVDAPVVRVLSVEDDEDDFALTALALQRADPSRRYELRRVDGAVAFEAALAEDFDVILCGYHLPAFSPYAALQILLARGCDTPLVVLTRAIGEEAAVHVMRCGAKDYLTKDRLATLPQVIDRVLAECRMAAEKRRLAAELEAAYGRLRQVSARVVLAQERERQLISRELHDQLGQSLAALMLHVRAGRRARDAQAFEQHAQTAEQLAIEAVERVKTLSFLLRPAQLDMLGLEAAVRSSVQHLAGRAGLLAEVCTRGTEPAPLKENASVALRILQEAVGNAVRHAGATRLAVRLRFLPDGRIGLLVLDDGAGFDREAVLGAGPREHNLGLTGMLERTELVGGRLAIRTRPGHGTAVRAVL